MANNYTKEYFGGLISQLEYVYPDKSSGQPFSFEKLFFPLNIDEGRYAFLSYSEQMEQARHLVEQYRHANRGEKESIELNPELVDFAERKGLSGMEQLERIRSRNGDDVFEKSRSTKTPFVIHKVRESSENPIFERLDMASFLSAEHSGKLASSQTEGLFGELPDGFRQLQMMSERDKAVPVEDVGNTGAFKLKFDENELDGDAEQGEEITVDVHTGSEPDHEALLEMMYKEPLSDILNSSLVTFRTGVPSRVLAIASAGHGKTTLLKRIALFYSRPYSVRDKYEEIGRRYGLTGDLIPVIIRLRETGKDVSIEKAIEQNVISVMETANAGKTISEMSILRWIETERTRLLLLIDGLDEIADSGRLNFLCSLEEYLKEYPKTKVVMTSRVAGLSESGVFDKLADMHFRGRSILPMTDEEAHLYSEMWIDITQPEASHRGMKRSLSEIMNLRKYRFLVALMHKPLELMEVLRQLAGGSVTVNRYTMLRDMLWAFFTGHEEFSDKRAVFSDTMTLLSFLAYKMQIKDSLYISVSEISQLTEELADLSFQTDMVGDGTVEEYIDVLERLAANVGVIEKDECDGETVYTFPIRTYQEYLTSYACCHIQLDPDSYKPDPQGVIISHLGDSRWSGITNFVLNDLEATGVGEFENLMEKVLEKADCEQVKELIEADITVKKPYAEIICRRFFGEGRMSGESKQLLFSCMNANNSGTYTAVLRSLYRANPEDYLDAYALATVFTEYANDGSSYDYALELIQKTAENENYLGAAMLSVLAETAMGEGMTEYADKAAKELELTEELANILYSYANSYNSSQFVKALENIWLTGCTGSEIATEYLDENTARIIVEKLNRCGDDALAMAASPDVTKVAAGNKLLGLIYALGAKPVHGFAGECKGRCPAVEVVISMLLELSRNHSELDRTAIIIAGANYCWDNDTYMELWTEEVCGCSCVDMVRKDNCSRRESRHFMMIKADVLLDNTLYMERLRQNSNKFNRSAMEEIIRRAGKRNSSQGAKLFSQQQYSFQGFDSGQGGFFFSETVTDSEGS